MSCLPVPPGCHPPHGSLHGEDTTIVTSPRRVVIGVDTHLDTIHLAAITDTGQLLGDAEFRTTPTGYYVAITSARSSGRCHRRCRGHQQLRCRIHPSIAGQRHSRRRGQPARPGRRRRQGKSDPLDAYAPPAPYWPATGWRSPKTRQHRRTKALQTRVAVRSKPAPRRSSRSKTSSSPPQPSCASATAATPPH